MKHTKEVLTAVGTLGIAVGIGFVMQSSETAKERYGADARPILSDTPPVETVPLTTSGSADILLQVQDIELTSASDLSTPSVPQTDVPVQRTSASIDAMPPAPENPLNASVCDVSATAQPVEGAMVALSLDAPCAPNERMTVHHNGMMFTYATDDAGAATFTVPALTRDAVFIMAFASGDGAVVQATVSDIVDYDRVVVQWRGRAGFELHAREFGADYGEPGHLWSGATSDESGFSAGTNGLITRLGDSLLPEPLMAEIYSFPAAMTSRPGVIDLSVEAEVTSGNCGREIEAQTLELSADGTLKTRNLTLAVPQCDAVGSFLVLNNLVSDLKVASN